MGTRYPDKSGGELELNTQIFKKYNGVVNNSSRVALPEDAWFYLENMQPIGDANVRSVPNISATLVSYGAHTIYWSQYINVAGNDYLINFSTDGFVYAYNIVAGTSAQIGSGLSGGGSRAAQWKNTQLLVIDSSGYYNWPGTGTLTLISGTGVPTSGTDIAVAFGRVWIVQGRLITFSGANDYSAASFTVANGAGSIAITDPNLRNNIVRLVGQNGYLYVIAATGINAISDVYVPTGASPPTPLFTNLNIQSIIGTDQPASIFAFNQALVFANKYGVWFLNGTNANKISSDIDGTWQYLSFTNQISGGQATVNNIICNAFLVNRVNDPILGTATVLAMWHDKKWWFANFGALTFVTSAIVNNTPTLFGFIGNNLVQCFANTNNPPATVSKTPLWDFGDSISDKMLIRVGFEVQIASFSGTFGMTVDAANGSQTAINLSTSGNVTWVNNSNNQVQWQNNSLAIVAWFSSAYLGYNSTSPGLASKYVGCTVSASGSAYQLSAINMDYKFGARWN